MGRHPFKKYDSAEEKLRKNRTRTQTFRMRKIGKLKQKLCEVCGEEKTQVHHIDYDDPLKIKWLCSKHHRIFHVKKKKREDAIRLTRALVSEGATTRETSKILEEEMGFKRTHAWVAIICKDLY